MNALLTKGDPTLMPKTGGEFTGKVTAYSNSSYTTKQVRNITLATYEPSSSDGSNGDLWFKYE